MSIKRIPNLIISKLNSREGLRKMKGNFIWLLADKILKMTVVMGVNIWMWNYIGTVQKGAWDYVLAVVTMLSPLASLGIDSIVIRDMVLSPKKTPRLLGASFILKLWGGILLTLFATLFVYFRRPDEPMLLYFVLITASSNIFLAFDSIDLYNQTHLISKYTVLSKSIGYIFTSILKIVFIIQGASIIAFVWTQFFEFAIGAMLMIFWYQKRGERIRSWNLDMNTAIGLLKQSWPLILTSFFMFIQQNIEKLFISDWLGDHELGVYTTASNFIFLFGFIPMIIYSTVAPEINKAKAISEPLFHYKLLRVYQIMFIIALMIIAGCFLFGQPVINLILKPEYKAAGTYMGIMSIRILFVNFAVTKTLFIINNNLNKYYMLTGIVGALINIILNYFWIPEYGVYGAIWSSIVSLLISIILIDGVYSKTRPNFIIMLRSMVDVKSYLSKPKF